LLIIADLRRQRHSTTIVETCRLLTSVTVTRSARFEASRAASAAALSLSRLRTPVSVVGEHEVSVLYNNGQQLLLRTALIKERFH